MICPKKKHSPARRDKRRAQSFRIATATLITCNACGEYAQPHRACRSCGTYKKSVVVAQKEA